MKAMLCRSKHNALDGWREYRYTSCEHGDCKKGKKYDHSGLFVEESTDSQITQKSWSTNGREIEAAKNFSEECTATIRV